MSGTEAEVFSFEFDPTGLPVLLYGALMEGMSKAAKREGYRLYFRSETGMTRVYADRGRRC